MTRIRSFVIVLLAICSELLPFNLTYALAVQGELTTVNGIRVLRLSGTPYEMGYAHGALLAEDIVMLLEEYMLGTLVDVDNYSRTRLLLQRYTHMPPAYWVELQGMYDGMRDVLGSEGLYSKKLHGLFQPVDLFAWNMVPEIFRLYFSSRGDVQACSSISGWGAGTSDGRLVFARNLEFGSPGDVLEQTPLIIAYKPCGLFRHAWVSITWPGYIGCLTGMNEAGIGAALNLGNAQPELDELLLNIDGVYIGIPLWYGSITFTLRQALEQWSPLWSWRDPLTHIFHLVRRNPVAGSFDIHVFAPATFTAMTGGLAAAVIECNNRGTALRTAADNRAAEPTLDTNYFLVVTNHHRKLVEPVPCRRYERLVELLNETDTLDMATALAYEQEVAQRREPFNTVHRVGMMPDVRELWIGFARDGMPAADVPPVHITWEDLFR
ncbi:MAG: C45 family autoproteolytic acyltransferase/hydrolase [Desulfobacterota bacterium]|nr:C45 family autoproteolytic acyltransferase/hydrolase [Thermodesulfobacteriota bacterium]